MAAHELVCEPLLWFPPVAATNAPVQKPTTMLLASLLCACCPSPTSPPVQAPIFILVLQMLFAAVVVRACSLLGLIEAEGMQWRLVQPFAPVAATFLGTLFANIKVGRGKGD